VAERDRLDQPFVPGRRLRRPQLDPEAFGQWTERVARFLGTGRFLIFQTGFIVFWITINVIPGIPHFDPYTFTFLTLVLSLQAAYAAPLILLAQNRQDDRDRANLVEDRQQAQRNLDDTEFLARELADVRFSLGEVVTRDFLRAELRDMIAELIEELSDEERTATVETPPRRKKKKPRKPKPEIAETSTAGAASGTVVAPPLTEPQHPEEPDENPPPA
jgi:uncharacterized membrane protein